MHFRGIFFSLPCAELAGDKNILTAQVIDNVMFCFCPVHSCANLRSVLKTKTTRLRLMYVGMLSLYSVQLCACDDGETVSRGLYHRMWYHFFRDLQNNTDSETQMPAKLKLM